MTSARGGLTWAATEHAVLWVALLAALTAALAAPGRALAAEGRPYVASVVVDAGTGAVLQAWNANRAHPPASLAKLMTAFLVLEALDDGRVPEGAAWPVSARAAAQPPTKMHLRAGTRVAVDTLLGGLVAVSANDAAVAVSEGLMGGEDAFVARMNGAARRLGMSGTRFLNASGLPHPEQLTTARDMAVLARALWARFPGRADLLGQRSVRYRGRSLGGRNDLLASYPGADGMKTGFTCRAGYNVVASAAREGRRIIAVVLGARTPGSRSAIARKLLDRAFARAPGDAGADLAVLAAQGGQGQDLAPGGRIIAESCLYGASGPPRRWSIDLGALPRRAEAQRRARAFIREHRGSLPGARFSTLPRWMGVKLHRVLVSNLDRKAATGTCLAYRAAGGDCVVISPQMLVHQVAQVERVKKLQRFARKSARRASD